MSQSVILYQQAVSFAKQADIAKAKRQPVDYKMLYEKAYLLEKEAALLLAPGEEAPVSCAMMLKNAAALAYKAGKYEESAKLVALCRTETLDGYIASSLDDIENAVNHALGESALAALNIQGIVTAANADEREIKIRDTENQRVYAFIVPANMFKKVVQSYWQERVAVVGHAGPQGIFTLDTIAPVA